MGNVLQDTAYRVQQPPNATAASILYDTIVSQEYRMPHRVTHSGNKASEVNALNMPLTPAMVVRVYPSLKQPRQTYRILSVPIRMPLGIGG